MMGASKHSCLLLALVFLDLSLAFTPSIVRSTHHSFVAMHSAPLQRSALRRAGDEHTRVNLQDAIVAPNNLLPPFFNRNL